ncbi:MAG: DUF971 domain-containing protein [Gemmatimonadales bacterium]|nr:DUF971 domain-containing protein [Gemmatimonadales bacterium]
MPVPVVPVSIARLPEGLLVEWDEGAPPVLYPGRALRLACPCAACVEEMSGRPLLDPAAVPERVWPLGVSLVGAYGLRVQWSDGHGTGIYTFRALREMPHEPPPAA